MVNKIDFSDMNTGYKQMKIRLKEIPSSALDQKRDKRSHRKRLRAEAKVKQDEETSRGPELQKCRGTVQRLGRSHRGIWERKADTQNSKREHKGIAQEGGRIHRNQEKPKKGRTIRKRRRKCETPRSHSK